jgi:hypothetical protein
MDVYPPQKPAKREAVRCGGEEWVGVRIGQEMSDVSSTQHVIE